MILQSILTRGTRKCAGTLSILVSMLLLLAGGCGRRAQVQVPPSRPQTRPAAQVPSAPPPVATPVPPVSTPKAPAEAPAAEPAVPSLETVSPSPGGPSIRIGLYTSALEVRLSSTAAFYLLEKTPETPRRLIEGEVQVRVERGGQARDIFSVQVASLSRSDAAEQLRRTLAEQFGVPAVVRPSANGQMRQVRVGEFDTRDQAQDFVATLREAGYPDCIVVRDTASSNEGADTTLALRGPDGLFRISSTGYLFLPASTGILRLDGKAYRGLLDITLNGNGRITVVNQLGMEEYLFGVVPSEISPSQFPEPAALAAQSIAARTYALKNMGKFRAQGFDLSADVRSQVYGGVPAERPATNDAVQKTAGLVLLYDGKLIDAMYSSTCGGRTEDFSNVFDGPPVPYLKSVACTVEDPGAGGTEARISGQNNLTQVIYADDGGIANRDLELASVLGIPGAAQLSVEFLSDPVRPEEVRSWTDRALKLAATGTAPAAPRAGDLTTRAGFLKYAAEALFGSAEIERRTTAADADYYLGNLKDGDAVPAPARRALAYLIESQLWRPYPDNTVRPNDPLRRSDALSTLVHWLESVRPDLLRNAVFSSGSRSDTLSGMVVKGGTKDYEIPLARDLRLFRLAAGRSTPVESLRVIGNERVRYHIGPQGAVDFLEIELNSSGASSDRYSPVAVWETTLARTAVAEKLRGMAEGIGELRDIRPARLGNSGRVVQIQIVGSRASVTLNGYRVRNALGLRDTLFTISREVNPEGVVDRFTFRGRGWGHGVGLCQVGAFGMARAGRTFEEILKTYYQGVELRKMY